jgi:predicted Zn finger-like uncharacterized protein
LAPNVREILHGVRSVSTDMKFTCDSCGAQYMISDDKVGPNGVKVRCKKCQHVVLVRRPAEVAAPAKPAASGAEPGLDTELGNAFESMLGGSPAPGAASAAAQDHESTQLMSGEDAAKIAGAGVNGAAGPAALQTEWYVAIGEVQVGPLPLPDVKRKWEAGDVGPDSLVWRPGMGDWAPLSTVSELASALAPVPQARSRAAAQRAATGMARSTEPTPVAPRKEEPTWKPAGASALAALANEEIASRAEAARPAAPRPAAGGGARSLVDQMNLPDAGGVDPTGAIPLPIRGVDTSPPPAARRSSVARGAAKVRQRRGILRGAVTLLAVVALLGGGGAFAYWYLTNRPPVAAQPAAVATAQPAPAKPTPAQPAPAQAAAAPPAPAAAPARPPAQPAPAQAAPAVAAAQPAPRPATAAPAAAAPARPPPAPIAEEPKPAPRPQRVAAAEPAPRPTRTERAAPQPPPDPPPAPAPSKTSPKKDSLLDFDSGSGGGSDALDEALGGTPSGRSVYVPPRPGSDLPAQLSASQINEAVVTQVDSLRRCVSEQKARDPEATGTLKMRWTIQGDGAVRDVKCLTPEYASGPFAKCITGVVRGIHFPRSGTKGQEVTFPFTF